MTRTFTLKLLSLTVARSHARRSIAPQEYRPRLGSPIARRRDRKRGRLAQARPPRGLPAPQACVPARSLAQHALRARGRAHRLPLEPPAAGGQGKAQKRGECPAARKALAPFQNRKYFFTTLGRQSRGDDCRPT